MDFILCVGAGVGEAGSPALGMVPKGFSTTELHRQLFLYFVFGIESPKVVKSLPKLLR